MANAFFSSRILVRALAIAVLVIAAATLLYPSATLAAPPTSAPPPTTTSTPFPAPTEAITGTQFNSLVCPGPNANIPPGGDFYSASQNYCTVNAPNGTMVCYYTGVDSLKYCEIKYKTGETRKLDQNNLLGLPGVEVPNVTDTTTDASGAEVASSDINTDQGGSCSIVHFDLLNCIGSAAGKLGASIILVFVGVFGMLLGWAGGLLNWVMLITVFQYSTYFGNSEGMLVAWSVLRDLGNIILLFGFIFIGLQTILNLGHFSVGKALPRLIIFAVLINFSLFVSEGIVDIANVFGATFYTQAGNVDCTKGVNMETCANEGIAGHIMKEAGLSGIFSNIAQIGDVWKSPDGVSTFFVYFGLLILLIIMLVVFLFATILFLIRAVTLMILLVTSPLGFAAMAIPQFEEYSKMWWNKLISNALFAPIFLLLILVGLKIMDGAGAIFNAGGASLTVALAKGSTGGVFILFALIVGFMIAALTVGHSLGTTGAGFALNQASKLGFGASARILNAGVGTMGWGMRRLGQTRAVQSTAVGRGLAGALLIAPGRAMENTNLDVRRVKPLEEALHHAGATSGTHPAHHASAAEMRHLPQQARNILDEGRRKTEEEIATRTLEREGHHGPLSAASAQHLAGMNTKELEALHGIQAGVETLAQNLSPEQFENLMKSENLTSAQKGRLRDARFSALGAQLNTATGPAGPAASAASAEVKRWTAKDIVASGFLGDSARIQQLSRAMSDSQYDDVMKNSNLTNAQKQLLRDAREGTGPGGRFDPANINATLSGMTPEAIAKLPGGTLSLPQVLDNLDVAEFAAIQKAAKVDSNTRQTLGRYIQAVAGNAADPRHTRFNSYITADPRVGQFWGI